MNTSSEAVKRLQEAIKAAKSAGDVVENLVAEHEYQDVAGLITQAAAAMLECASLLMQGDDEAALDNLDRAEDLLDEVYGIIDGEVDEE
jgi:hypothetical protein